MINNLVYKYKIKGLNYIENNNITLAIENYEDANKWLDMFMEKEFGCHKIVKYKIYIRKNIIIKK